MKKNNKKIDWKFICKFILDDIKTNYIFYIVLLVILLLNVIKLNYYVFAPGSLTPLENRILIKDSYPEKGSFNLTYVTSRNGTLLNVLMSYIIPDWDLVDVSELRAEGESDKTATKRGQISLEQTSYDAIVAAFAAAGKEYEIKSLDLVVTYIYDMAESDLKVGDVVKKINGIDVPNTESLHAEVDKYKANDEINITVERDGKTKECKAVLKDSHGKPIIGIIISELKEVVTNPEVDYVFKKTESGSSRGLMCALEIYNKITEFDLTKGRTIAGTGVIYEDGSVGEIDGIKYKIIGAVKEKADIFIVPEKNYEEAEKIVKKNNYKIKLIKATNLNDVIEELKK